MNDRSNARQQTMTLGDLHHLLSVAGGFAYDVEEADLEIALGDRHYPVTCLMDDDADACLPDPGNEGATLLIHGSPRRALEERRRETQELRDERDAAISKAEERWEEIYGEIVEAAYGSVRDALLGLGIAVDCNGDTEVGALVEEEFAEELFQWLTARIKKLGDELKALTTDGAA